MRPPTVPVARPSTDGLSRPAKGTRAHARHMRAGSRKAMRSIEACAAGQTASLYVTAGYRESPRALAVLVLSVTRGGVSGGCFRSLDAMPPSTCTALVYPRRECGRVPDARERLDERQESRTKRLSGHKSLI